MINVAVEPKPRNRTRKVGQSCLWRQTFRLRWTMPWWWQYESPSMSWPMYLRDSSSLNLTVFCFCFHSFAVCVHETVVMWCTGKTDEHYHIVSPLLAISVKSSPPETSSIAMYILRLSLKKSLAYECVVLSFFTVVAVCCCCCWSWLMLMPVTLTSWYELFACAHIWISNYSTYRNNMRMPQQFHYGNFSSQPRAKGWINHIPSVYDLHRHPCFRRTMCGFVHISNRSSPDTAPNIIQADSAYGSLPLTRHYFVYRMFSSWQRQRQQSWGSPRLQNNNTLSSLGTVEQEGKLFLCSANSDPG